MGLLLLHNGGAIEVSVYTSTTFVTLHTFHICVPKKGKCSGHLEPCRFVDHVTELAVHMLYSAVICTTKTSHPPYWKKIKKKERKKKEVRYIAAFSYM